MSETAVVTGGLGRAGRWVVDAFAEAGYETVCVDLDHPGWEITPRENVDFRAADLVDAAETFDLFADLDPDAVAHLAALPAATRHAGSEVFETSVESTYNVLTAAGRAGARGRPASPPTASRSPARRPCRMSSPSPSLTNSARRTPTASRRSRARRPRSGRRGATTSLWCRCGRRGFNTPATTTARATATTSRRARATSGRTWTPETSRASSSPPRTTWTARPSTSSRSSSADFEDCALEGEQSALSPAKARRLLGWTPEHTWREAADADVSAPELYEEPDTARAPVRRERPRRRPRQ